jgi:hypothetical protein
MSHTPTFVEIVFVPEGEAPLWVRERWVGLRLPLALNSRGPMSLRTFGVLSAPKSVLGRIWGVLSGKAFRENGFVVFASDAVDVLERTHPDAAAWWRSNAAHLLQPGLCLVFQPQCGRVFKPTD